jgi:hypothetical protein
MRVLGFHIPSIPFIPVNCGFYTKPAKATSRKERPSTELPSTELRAGRAGKARKGERKQRG